MSDTTVITSMPAFPNEVSPLKSKAFYSAIGALIFLVLSIPLSYKLTNSSYLSTYSDECPTPTGKFLFTILFFFVSYFMMKIAQSQMEDKSKKSDSLMLKYSFYSALIFFLVSSTDTYKLTGSIHNGIANQNGCPSIGGIIVHTVVFFALLLLAMHLPNDQ
jgi:hypothetical protein